MFGTTVSSMTTYNWLVHLDFNSFGKNSRFTIDLLVVGVSPWKILRARPDVIASFLLYLTNLLAFQPFTFHKPHVELNVAHIESNQVSLWLSTDTGRSKTPSHQRCLGNSIMCKVIRNYRKISRWQTNIFVYVLTFALMILLWLRKLIKKMFWTIICLKV